jgi:carbon storage regulator CsrA
MLVLTRRADQKIVFPNLGVTLQVLRIRGNIVKIGIDAPADVTVLRHEIADGEATPAPQPDRLQEMIRERRHAVRNRLNAVKLGLHLYQKQIEKGLVNDANATFERLLEQFAILDGEIANSPEAASLRAADGIGHLVRKVEARKQQALIVEDDLNESELLAGFLRLNGFEVVTAGDGADALEYLKSHNAPEFVLLDMKMPRLDGPQTVEMIRRDPRLEGLKVFAISGTAPSDLGVLTGPAGIDRWFAKPLNPEVLVNEMKRELAT